MDERRSLTVERSLEMLAPRGMELGTLSAERTRLIGFCARITGDRDAAEDLAQETLVTAWRNQDTLRDPAAHSAWLTGIARNLCLRHIRKISHERRRLSPRDGSETPMPYTLERVADDRLPDPEEYLERAEIAELLDKALGALPRATHDLLIARYVEGLPLAEIATRRGQREETTAVHLHRGRQALRRVLIGPKLRDESLALGLVRNESEAHELVETRIWCPKCGKRHLQGHLIHGLFPLKGKQSGKSESESAEEEGTQFMLRCPSCDGEEGLLIIMHLLRSSPNCDLLEGVKGLKPALNRVSIWWENFAQVAASRRLVPCTRCGTPSPVTTCIPGCEAHGVRAAEPALFSHCPKCGASCSIGVMDIALNIQAGREFWRDNPRLVAQPAQTVLSADGTLVVTRLKSVTGSATLDVVCRADTLEVVRTERG